ncbi:hypothetical protein [Sinimarinibacterium flocculans]|uniref:hypothetical protein n=1 Tax=Sinimarinibacterium flocculans TaxID=985250 RepID=UPI0024907578|nr:hypothetical protein [Sinimarinibacterium flocculans]
MPLIWTCPAGSESTAAGVGVEYPACATGQGQWIEQPPTTLLGVPIDEESFGDLLSIVLVLFALAYSIKIVKRVMENRR